MLEGNTDEIRMEINSCFVKTHEYWEKRRGGKNWIAHITGLDTKYGYKREFLQTVKVGREKVFRLEDFRIAEIYEVASMYTAGASKCVHVRSTYECEEITEDQVILRCITQDEVIGRFGETNGNVVAENLVKQLLNIVTKDEAVTLISEIAH